MLVSLYTESDGTVYVIVVAQDGGYIPAGTIRVTLNYSVWSDVADDYMDLKDDSVAAVEFEGTDASYAIIPVDASVAEHVTQAGSVIASMTVGDDVIYSSVTAFSYVEA